MDFYLWRESPVRDLGTALERARAGAAYLDERHGPHWTKVVDAETLSIASPFRCVLGQLALAGLDTWLSINRSVDYGFSCGPISELLVPFVRSPSLQRPYHLLDEAWRIVLDERAYAPHARVVHDGASPVRASRRGAPLAT